MFSTYMRGTGPSFNKERCLQESIATKNQRVRNVHCRRTAYRLSVDGVFQCVETSSDHMVNCMGVSLCRDETFFDGNHRYNEFWIYSVYGKFYLKLVRGASLRVRPKNPPIFLLVYPPNLRAQKIRAILPTASQSCAVLCAIFSH